MERIVCYTVLKMYIIIIIGLISKQVIKQIIVVILILVSVSEDRGIVKS